MCVSSIEKELLVWLHFVVKIVSFLRVAYLDLDNESQVLGSDSETRPFVNIRAADFSD